MDSLNIRGMLLPGPGDTGRDIGCQDPNSELGQVARGAGLVNDGTPLPALRRWTGNTASVQTPKPPSLTWYALSPPRGPYPPTLDPELLFAESLPPL